MWEEESCRQHGVMSCAASQEPYAIQWAERAQGCPALHGLACHPSMAAVKQACHPAGADCSCMERTVRMKLTMLRPARRTSASSEPGSRGLGPGLSKAAACQRRAPCWSALRAGLKPALERSPSAMSRSSRQGASTRGSTTSQQAGAAACDRARADADQAGAGTPAEWARMQTELQQLQVRSASAPGARRCRQESGRQFVANILAPCMHANLLAAPCEPQCCDKDATGMQMHPRAFNAVCRSSRQCCWGW